jgi:hypothetical protein
VEPYPSRIFNSQNLDQRNPDGTLKLRNPNIAAMDSDFLYHLALGTATHDLPAMFGDVKVRIKCQCSDYRI